MKERELDEPTPATPEDAVAGTETAVESRQPDIEVTYPTTPLQWPLTARGLLISGIAGGLAAAILAIRSVAAATLPHILTIDPGINYQEVTDGIPVPHLLNWDLGKIEAMISLRDLSGVSLMLFRIAVYATLLLFAGRALNPTFRLFQFGHPHTEPTKAANDGTTTPVVTNHLSRTLEVKGMAKIGTIALIIGAPVAIVWLLTGPSMHSLPLPNPATDFHLTAVPLGWTWGVRLSVLGAAIFAAFHPAGLGGDFGRREIQRAGGSVWRLAAIGVAWGGILYFLIQVCRSKQP